MKSYRNLSDAIEQLRRNGFEGDFLVNDRRARHSLSNREYSPGDLRIVDVLRFEGASNPDDMAVLYLIEADNGDRGTIVDAFGTYADVEIGDFVKNVRREDAEFRHQWGRSA